MKKYFRIPKKEVGDLYQRFMPVVDESLKGLKNEEKLAEALYRAACSVLGHHQLDFSKDGLEPLDPGKPAGIKCLPRGSLIGAPVAQLWLNDRALSVLAFMQAFYANGGKAKPSLAKTFQRLSKARIRKPTDWISGVPKWGAVCYICSMQTDFKDTLVYE